MSDDPYLNKTRIEYAKGALDEAAVASDPFMQFRQWFEVAVRDGGVEPNACALATTGLDLQPTVRMVLMKSFDERGFVFFTHYDSAKGRHLAANPKAAMLFYWSALERQVRIEGVVERTTELESDEYFRRRPRGSQLGAAASTQSQVVSGRIEMNVALERVSLETSGREVPRPPGWGGYRLVPALFEFWQGRENRMHDRLVYRPTGGEWGLERLWP